MIEEDIISVMRMDRDEQYVNISVAHHVHNSYGYILLYS